MPADIEPLPIVCPVFGTPLDYSGNGGPDAASVDRIDSKKGYLPGNVAVMSVRANRLKTSATADELQAIVDFLRSRVLRNYLDQQELAAITRRPVLTPIPVKITPAIEFKKALARRFPAKSKFFRSATERRKWIRKQLGRPS